jgi:hypothetical protein
MAGDTVPSFSKTIEKYADGEVNAVAKKLAKRYAMYKLAAICAVVDSPCNVGIKEDDVLTVSAAQDLKD